MNWLVLYGIIGFYVMGGFGMDVLLGVSLPRKARVWAFIFWPVVLFGAGFVAFIHFIGEA